MASFRDRLRRRLLALRTKYAPIVRPALHTFWQSFVGIIGGWWLLSGTDAWNQVSDVASAKRFAFALLAAVVASGGSAVKNTVKQYLAKAG